MPELDLGNGKKKKKKDDTVLPPEECFYPSLLYLILCQPITLSSPASLQPPTAQTTVNHHSAFSYIYNIFQISCEMGRKST